MLTLLVPVDGSPGSSHAVNLVIKWYRDIGPVHIRLLHVLPPDDGIAIGLTHREADPANDPADGTHALSSARTVLDREGIPYDSDVKSGFVPSTIIQYGRTMDCNGIVMGTRGMGTTDALLGSIARQVIKLADVPVTLVK